MTNGGPVTVVVLPPEREDDLLSLAQEWTAAWLIRSAIWIRASDLLPDPVSPEAPPLAYGYVMGRNGTARVPLFSELSRREYDLLRFVTVRSIEPGSAYNQPQDDAVRLLEEHLRLSKPDTTHAQFVNLVFAPTRHSGGSSAHVVERGWNVNIVVSPEDRRTSNSFDAFTRHSSPKEWTGFVLAHAVTAAGLWSTVGTGPYDETNFDGFMEGTHVQRIVVRGVLTGALVVNVGAQALRMASQDSCPLADPLIAIGEQDLRVMSEVEEAAAISELVRVTVSLGGSQLAYRPVAGPPTLAPRRIGFGAQMRELVVFGGDKIRDTPSWFSRLLRSRASRKVSQELHGEGSDTLVDAGGILSREDADLTDAVAELDRQRQAMLARFDEPISARRHDIDGPLFESVRQASFALLDGSPLPEGHAMRTVWAPEERAPIVRSITSIVPDWRESWTPSDEVRQELGSFARLQGTPSHWLDVDFTQAWRDELSRRSTRLAERESMLRDRIGASKLEIHLLADELEDASGRLDALRDEVRWLAEDLEEHEAQYPHEVHGETQDASDTRPPPLEKAAREGADDPKQDPPEPTDSPADTPTADTAEEGMPEASPSPDSAPTSEPLPPSVTEAAPLSPRESELQQLRDELMAREEELHQAERQEQKALRSLERVTARRTRSEQALGALDAQMSRLTRAAEDLSEWTAGRSNSYSWQLLERLSSEQQGARGDLGQLREALEAPLAVRVERPSQLQNRFMWRCIGALAVTFIAWLLTIWLKNRVPTLSQVAPAINPIAWPVWLSGLACLLTCVALWVLFLVLYYKETSRRRHVLRQVATHVEYLGSAVVATRQELQRLESLHEQVPEYLRYLSEVLHRPWTLPHLASLHHSLDPEVETPEGETPEEVLFGASRPDSTNLPSLMRLAEPPLGAGGDKEAALVRDAVRALMYRGWRYGALCQLLQAVEQAEAVPAGTFDVARVDRDAGIRAAVLKSVDSSDARVRAGREQLRSLARRIHVHVMDEIHPPVQELVEDPLKDLELVDDILAEGDWRTKEWDEFLSEAIGPSSEWSTTAFSLDGLTQGVPEVRSLAYGPERLADRADSQVAFSSVRDDTVRPIELVIRIDRSPASLGPVRFHVFAGQSNAPRAGPADSLDNTSDIHTGQSHVGSESLKHLDSTTSVAPSVAEESESLA